MLWGITAYFNPAGYRSRLSTYLTFRKNLQIPLVAVELSFNRQFELRDDDAEIVVRLIGKDVLWQKERLLNLGLRALPRECDAVAWLDCDVVFANEAWPQLAYAALTQFPIVQLFSERCNLARGAIHNEAGWSPVDIVAPGVGHTIAIGRLQPDDLRVAGNFTTGRPTTGLAWAARRPLLERHRLYDASVMGGGDRAIVCAAIGRFDSWIDAVAANDRQRQHYLAWGEPFLAEVGGKLGYVDGRIFHLWHGDASDRRYSQRHRELGQFDFDPSKDISIDANGCWQWSSNKPAMHRFVRDYFLARKEDG